MGDPVYGGITPSWCERQVGCVSLAAGSWSNGLKMKLVDFIFQVLISDDLEKLLILATDFVENSATWLEQCETCRHWLHVPP